jgi:hypothetical protein
VPASNFSDYDQDLITIGKTLEKSLESDAMRALLKNESLAKFDLDYDVMVQMILDKEVEPGKTVLSVLQDHSGVNILPILNKFPLLTIYVPALKGFSAETWDVKESIPSIAIAYKDVNGRIPLINADMTTTTVSVMEEPNYPVIVLKENERLGVIGRFTTNSSKVRVAYSNSRFSYYFFNTDIDQVKASRLVGTGSLDLKVRESYSKSTNCATCYQRDYIWYNISLKDGVTEGPFDQNYTEAITYMTFESMSALQTVTGNWTEGILEFHFVFTFVGGNGGITTLEKVYFENASAFSNGGNLGFVSPMIQIVPWRMNEYGDRWKVRIFEYDPGTTTTVVSSSTSTFGVNFKADASGNLFGIKFEAGVGSSSTWSQTNSTTIATTIESNQLGEAILSWYDPVVVVKPTPPMQTWTTKEISTGAVKISIEPIRVN